MKKTSKIIAIALALLLAFSVSVSAYSPKEMTDSVSGWLLKNITVQQAGTNIDSYLDWTVFAMQRGGDDSYKAAYKDYIGNAVNTHFDEMYLSDFARVSLTVMSVGMSARNVGGRNLLQAIVDADLSKEAYTGGIAYAILALDAANNYSPEKQEELKKVLLASQRNDGGFNAYLAEDPEAYWTLTGETDSTGMALQALAVFTDDIEVNRAISDAIAFLKGEQMDNGGFGSYGSASAESTSQVLMGLCAVGADPLSSDFTKGNNTMLTSLSSFINPDGGARCWDGTSNIMTGYQLLCGLNAYERFTTDSVGIYEMSTLDVICHSISYSFLGERLTRVADILCKVITFVYNLIGIDSYR